MAKKLGIKDGHSVVVIDAPATYRNSLEPLPPDVKFSTRAGANTNLVHLFTAKRAFLAHTLQALRDKLAPDATVWVSWPKKSSKVATDITEDTIREVALPMGWVDIKVCAVDDVWSGLKLVVRKELR
ncbi:MAG: DUF3052 domain-containing protein [Gemmatimonas sp.]